MRNVERQGRVGRLSAGFASALLLAASAEAFAAPRVIARDDFEADRVRDGNPRIVEGTVSDGLLVKTRQAVYSTASSLNLPLAGDSFAFAGDDASLLFRISFRLYALSENGEIAFEFASGGKKHRRVAVKRGDTAALAKRMPVDVSYRVGADGCAELRTRSLIDSASTAEESNDAWFRYLDGAPFSAELSLSGAGAEMKIDEYEIAACKDETATPLPDFTIDAAPEFDPVKAGWKLTFEDTFDGPEGESYDTNKWYHPSWAHHENYLRLDGKGHLAVKGDIDPGTTNVSSSSIWTIREQRYGYFEAKVKFTKNNGWWSYFFLYAWSNRNPTECGSEIDIFEDYFTRYPDKNALPGGFTLDHNLHISFGNRLKSLNYNGFVSGSMDEFHTIGCKWTPFEISYYMDGKLMKAISRNPVHPTVTFDAFNHSAISAPMHAIVGGKGFRDWGPRDISGCTFPEYYLVDHVRIYEYPEDGKPQVRWTKRPAGGFVADGTEIELEVEAKPGKAPVKAAYLFDNGAYLQCRTEPPFRFKVPFSKAYYEGTRFMRPGRQGKKPEWDDLMHSLDVFVQDAEGRVNATDDGVHLIPAPADGLGRTVAVCLPDAQKPDAAKYTGAQSIPGQIVPAPTLGLHTGEFLSIPVDVKKSGTYRCVLEYAPMADMGSKLEVMVDGKIVARSVLEYSGRNGQGAVRKAKPVEIEIPAGRHVVTLLPTGYIKITGFDVL